MQKSREVPASLIGDIDDSTVGARPFRLAGHLGVEREQAGAQRAGFESSHRLDRRDLGCDWNTPLDSGGVPINDTITAEVEFSLVHEVEAHRRPAALPPALPAMVIASTSPELRTR